MHSISSLQSLSEAKYMFFNCISMSPEILDKQPVKGKKVRFEFENYTYGF